MLSYIKSIELIGNLLKGKRDQMQSDLYIPQKPMMPHKRNPQPMERAVPESQGISSRYLDTFVKAMSDKTLACHGIMAARHGKIIVSGSFTPYREDVWHISHSMCKSITSMAVGIAISEGYFQIDDSIYDIFPEESKWRERFRAKNIKIRDLLTMSTGIAFNELTALNEDNWVEGFLSSFEVFAPGTDFAYNSTNTFMLSAIIQERTGMKLLDYLNEKLLHPMGIYDLYWEESPSGINKGGWGLSLWLEDMVKLGQLCLNGGRWKGQQLLPEAWLQEAVKKQIDTPEAMNRYGYGYQFWLCERPGAYQFNGMLGQNVVILPDLDMVIAVTGGNTSLFPEGPMMRVIMDFFGKEDCPVFDGPLEEDLEGVRKLKNRCDQLSFQNILPPVRKIYQTKGRFKGKNIILKPTLPSGEKIYGNIPKILEKIIGRIYQMEENTASVIPLMLQMIQNNYSMGIRAFRFIVKDESLWLETREGDAVHRLIIGFDEPYYTKLELNGEYFIVGTIGKIRENEDGEPVLYMMSSFIETTSTNIMKFVLDPDHMLVKFDEVPRVDEVVMDMDVLIPVRGIRDLNPVKKMSDTRFAKSEVEKTVRQSVWSFCVSEGSISPLEEENYE